jgi:hypothetical protein
MITPATSHLMFVSGDPRISFVVFAAFLFDIPRDIGSRAGAEGEI